MKSPDSSRILLDAFRSAVNSTTVRGETHIVDDDDTLAAWSLCGLSKTRHGEILNHLSQCSYCRTELAAMVKAGVLELPGAASACCSLARKTRNTLLVMAVAATIVAGVVWGPWKRSSESLLELARQRLADGQPQIAMLTVEEFLDTHSEFGLNDQTVATRLLDESGYQTALRSLQQRNFQQVLQTEEKLAERIPVSARWRNLHLQAKRGIPAEISLMSRGALTDYGYDFDGYSDSSNSKAMARVENPGAGPVVKETKDPIAASLQEAVESYPDDIDLRLNYGQYLFERIHFELARIQFQAVLKRDPANVLAHVGLGLIAFRSDEFEHAFDYFQTALQNEPNDAALHINAAICLERLGRADDAAAHWHRALALTKDGETRDRIRRQMNDRIESEVTE